MHHIHLHSCPSTQTYLKNNVDALLAKDKDILISTSKQTEGIGRSGNSWNQYTNAVAFSFTIKPVKNITITPLAIGVAMVNAIKSIFSIEIKLKWPNDLIIHQNKKCGGIICNYHSNNIIICGIGLNLGKIDKDETISDYKTPAGLILPDLILNKSDYKNIPQKLYKYILESKIENQAVITQWNEYCVHIQKYVTIVSDNIKTSGKFLGIDKSGEAIIIEEKSKMKKKFLTGSLSY